MAYSPGQAWDETLSYTYGQTCVYRDLPYVYWHPTSPSTPGVTPLDEMRDFVATDYGSSSFPYPTATRSERAWVLADEVVNDGSGGFFARYGNVKMLQSSIRGLPESIEYAGAALYENSLFPSFWSPTPGNLTDYSWNFYGLEGLSAEFGKANNLVDPPIPESQGNPNISSNGTIWPLVLRPTAYDVSVPQVSMEPTGPQSADIEVSFAISPSPVTYWPWVINQFNRDASYTIYVTIDGPGGTSYQINGTISSGPFRDGYSLRGNSVINKHSISWLPTQSMSWSYVLTGISPRFDA